MSNFFDAYPAFYGEELIRNPKRLNARYRAIIESHRELIEGANILDVAAFDCRWTFAAIKAGAEHVTAVEIKPHYLRQGEAKLEQYKVDPAQYDLINADLIEHVESLPDDSFDLALCCGYLYHTIEHYRVLKGLRRVAKRVIVDTSIMAGSDTARMTVRLESDYPIGILNLRALELILDCAGLQSRHYVDWPLITTDWEGVQDYQNGSRVTFLCS